MTDFKGKVAVVTGGAKGIGRCIVETFAKGGAQTVILDFDSSAGETLADEINGRGESALFIKTDVSQVASLGQARDLVMAQLGRIDLLVINAGISYHHSLQEIDVEEWQRVININLSGSFYTIKAFLADLIQQKNQGKVVFITSGSGITGTGGGAHYAASKSGQHGLMRNLAKELGPLGINVNAIAPRVIQTDILDHLYPTEESREVLLKQIPLGRIGQPQDIANLAVFLASPESSYIHGQIILADGGRTY
ncbi:SDR family oxidoreductase [Vagococcus sp. BWB3-3]|uniref:SDR family oxidoreductase n=1 Tax=Vagococcus allomyrinae TaxID=2794353 RepID=A0A940PDM4_9ENTE|nr:SDR family NAD(P)-dependent oxidoreductase [Vagococcus allomyrinae]MBP1040883.1 SDR family oxidoreductase [Vagococcus allomyrinae]